MIQNSKNDKEIRQILDADQKSLKQLQAQLKKAQKMNSNADLVSTLQNSLKEVEQWYSEFKVINLSSAEIIKRITDGHKSQDELKEQYDALMKKKDELKIKFDDGGSETRVLNKINKWNQVALDCRQLVSDESADHKFTPERLHELDEMI